MGLNHVRDYLETDREWQSAGHKLLALVMAYAADRRGIIRLTQQELANEVRLSIRRVAMLIDDLCNAEVLRRLGHGRYGLRFGMSGEDLADQPLAKPKGAKDRQAAILAFLKERQGAGDKSYGIAYSREGWPVLQKWDGSGDYYSVNLEDVLPKYAPSRA